MRREIPPYFWSLDAEGVIFFGGGGAPLVGMRRGDFPFLRRSLWRLFLVVEDDGNSSNSLEESEEAAAVLTAGEFRSVGNAIETATWVSAGADKGAAGTDDG